MTGLLILGFLLGMRHAVEADHVAAVATLVQENESLRNGVRQGVFWGLGHTITLFLFASIAILFGGTLTETVAHWLEFAVGALLLLLGLDVIRRVRKQRIHFHLHHHPGQAEHFHAHSHRNSLQHDDAAHRHQHSIKQFPARALFVGLMHGMAGASALILLTLNSIESPYLAMVYVLLFGLGSMAGMAVLSLIIAWPLRRSAKGMTGLYNVMQYCLATFTIILGVNIMISNFP